MRRGMCFWAPLGFVGWALGFGQASWGVLLGTVRVRGVACRDARRRGVCFWAPLGFVGWALGFGQASGGIFGLAGRFRGVCSGQQK